MGLIKLDWPWINPLNQRCITCILKFSFCSKCANSRSLRRQLMWNCLWDKMCWLRRPRCTCRRAAHSRAPAFKADTRAHSTLAVSGRRKTCYGSRNLTGAQLDTSSSPFFLFFLLFLLHHVSLNGQSVSFISMFPRLRHCLHLNEHTCCFLLLQ